MKFRSTYKNKIKYYIIIFFVVCLSSFNAIAKQNLVNIFPAGSFEFGLQNLEVYRYPKFYQDVKSFSPIVISEKKAISGSASLYLPSLNYGGYKLVPHVFMLEAGTLYPVSLVLNSDKKATVRIEVIQNKKKIAVKKFKPQKGVNKYEFSFSPKTSRGNKSVRDLVPVSLNIWVSSKSAVKVDDLSIFGAVDLQDVISPIVVETNNTTSVYGIGESASAKIMGTLNDNSKLYYKIRNTITGSVLSTGPVSDINKINIPTAMRGAYWVEIWSDSSEATSRRLTRRSFVVINKDSGSDESRHRYGVSLEEHGQRTQVNARLKGGELYQLASELGAGNVRLFTAVMPDLLSAKGHIYDYSLLDHSLDYADKFRLEPLIELGSNLPNRIPAWMKTDEDSDAMLDLRDGLRTKKLKLKFEKTKGGNYLDLSIYESYLESVFKHIDGRVKYYEIWNEPGHKFTPDAFNRIAQLTRKVQSRLQPNAKLLGFTSTKGKGLAVEKEGIKSPKFLLNMLDLDADKSIDILTYHSEHAFRFLGKKFDYRNEETGYVELIRATLSAKGKSPMDVWDTERGVPWTSHNEERADRLSGKLNTGRMERSHNYLEVSRRLPAIHAASFAADVKKLFWFYMDSSTATITKLHHRFGFFDAQLEPMPHIPVYDAMTELLGNKKFERLIDMGSGTRAYLFSDNEKVIALLYNWKEKEETITYELGGHSATLLDIMGNPVNDSEVSPTSGKLSINVSGWPSYLLLDNADADEIEFK